MLTKCHHWTRGSTQQRRMYSVNRLFALRDYCDSTSRTRVFFVLLLYCTPALLLMVLFDLLPLQDPSDGWRANVTYWVRTTVGIAVVCNMMMMQIQSLVQEIKFTTRQRLTIAVGVSVGYTASLMLFAEFWMFPVPFTYTVGGLPFSILMNSLMWLTLGSTGRARLATMVRDTSDIGIQAALIMVYPGYNAIFLSLRGNAQLAFVLVLPLIKYGFKSVMSKMHRHDDDLVTALSATVDIFDALYMTKCMQSAGTLAVGAAIIGIDVVQNCLEIARLSKCTARLREMLPRTRSIRNNEVSSALLPWAVETLKYSKASDSFKFQPCRSYSLSVHSQQMLSILQSQQSQKPPRGQTEGSATIFPNRKVLPIVLQATAPPATPCVTSNKLSLTDAAVIETMQLLHVSESVAIVEYIETIVPVVYAIYIAILFHLPNAKYYQDMHEFTEARMHSVVTNILVYALMELLSLAFVHWSVKRSFGVSVFYQLAFALESERTTFQCHFLSWILIVFQFLLVHNGVDFSFQFRQASGGS